MYCSPWGHKELDMTEQLNWTELNCCTQYTSKFRKLSSGHRMGKRQCFLNSGLESLSAVIFGSQRGAMKKTVYITEQLCSFHMLARLCSKAFMLGFSSMWIQNFQLYNLGLEKAEEPETKLPTSVGPWRKQENSGKKSTSASLIMVKSLTVYSQQTVENA